MYLKKIKNLISYIFADGENLSLENRLFLSAIIVGILTSVVGSFINFIVATSIIAGIIPLILTTLLIILYYFVRFKNIFKLFALPMIVISMLGISVIWIYNGGINGSNSIVALVILILALIVVSDKLKNFIVCLFILLNIILYLIQLNRPDLITNFPTETDRWIDSIITLTYVSIFIFLIIKFLHKHYTIERLRAEENAKKLQELNLVLTELNNSKDKFFSIIAHDLRGPFSGFLGLTKLMAEQIQDLTMKEMMQLTSNMQISAENLYNLLENLLEWSRMERGITEFNPQLSMLSPLIEQNIEIVREWSKQKEITIIKNVDEKTNFFADIPMTNSVLRNLISNAVKFTPRGGKIEIGIIKSSDDLKSSHNCIYVKDSGIGMKKEMLEKLFRIDQKTSRQGTEGESSTGLGLLLCKEFVEKNGGKIWVESEEGMGSTFYFSLPKS